MGAVHHHRHPVYFKAVVVFLGQIKAQYVCETGAAPAFHADAQTIVVGNLFGLTDGMQLLHRTICKSDRCCNSSRGINSSCHVDEFIIYRLFQKETRAYILKCFAKCFSAQRYVT